MNCPRCDKSVPIKEIDGRISNVIECSSCSFYESYHTYQYKVGDFYIVVHKNSNSYKTIIYDNHMDKRIAVIEKHQISKKATEENINKLLLLI